MRILKFFFLILGLGICLSSLSLGSDEELTNFQVSYQHIESEAEYAQAITKISKSSNFRHAQQQANWVSFNIIDDFLVPTKADKNYYSEPIKAHWFETIQLPDFRMIRWKNSNFQFRWIALKH